MKRSAAFFLLGVIGCGGSEDSTAGGSGAFTTFSDDMPDDLPAGGCRDTEGCETEGTESGGAFGTTGGSVVDSECELSEECDGAGACVATWDDGDRGPFECRFACIPTLDETSWCSDDASCCEESDVCTPRGYCVPSEDDGSGSTGGGSTGGSSGGDSTGG